MLRRINFFPYLFFFLSLWLISHLFTYVGLLRFSAENLLNSFSESIYYTIILPYKAEIHHTHKRTDECRGNRGFREKILKKKRWWMMNFDELWKEKERNACAKKMIMLAVWRFIHFLNLNSFLLLYN